MTMYRPRIGIDVDDTVSDFFQHMLKMYNREYEGNLTISNFHDFDIRKCVDAHTADRLFGVFTNTEYLAQVPLLDGAVDAIAGFVGEGYDVYFISACHPSTHGVKSEWLRKCFPFISIDNHIYTQNKYLFNIDYLVDDNPMQLRKGTYTRILLDRHWNRIANENWFDYRVDNLAEAKKLINKLTLEVTNECSLIHNSLPQV